MNVGYFLSKNEQQTFRGTGVDLGQHWPAILFASGMGEVGADIAMLLEQKRFRHNSLHQEEDRFDFPCIVLTGLLYTNLMDSSAVECLWVFRDFEVLPTDIPLTYGY